MVWSHGQTGLLLWLMWTYDVVNKSTGIKLTGGRQTAVRGQDVSLPCLLAEKPATEEITQVFWKKTTQSNTEVRDFFTVSPEYGPELVADKDSRFKFIGNLKANDGSLHFSNVTLLDEGVYTCIFTLFPAGPYRAEIPLTVLVPPVTSLNVEVPALVEREHFVTYASCIGSDAKPPADVTWDTGSSQDFRVTTYSTRHANGTTTTVSQLAGVPTRNVNHRLVQCVVKQQALATEKTLPVTLEVHYAPLPADIRETSKDAFECMSDSSPKANYTWSRVDQSWPSAGRREGGRLQFPSLTSELEGLYACEASNRYGRQQVSLYVYHAADGCMTCWNGFVIFIVVGLVAAAAAAAAAVLVYFKPLGTFSSRIDAIQKRFRSDAEPAPI